MMVSFASFLVLQLTISLLASAHSVAISKPKFKVLIAGGGPCGLLAAHCLLSRGDKFKVDIHESREDPRATIAGPRAYSLGLNIRGQSAVKYFDQPSRSPGLWESIFCRGVESESFFLHIGSMKIPIRKPRKQQGSTDASTTAVPTLLIPRNKLCEGMLESLESTYSSTGRLNVYFNSRLTTVNLDKGIAEFEVSKNAESGAPTIVQEESYDLIIGADGVQSVLRSTLEQQAKNIDTADVEDSSLTPFRSESVVLPGQYKVNQKL